jgi:hypothetical protein
MFRFIVKYFGVLKYIPFFAGLVDALTMIWNSLFNPELINAIEKIENEVAGWNDIQRSVHKFGGIQFNCGTREVGHIHSNGILDILFSRKMKADLLQGGRISDHHVFMQSGWISFYIHTEADIQMAIELLALSYKIKRQC